MGGGLGGGMGASADLDPDSFYAEVADEPPPQHAQQPQPQQPMSATEAQMRRELGEEIPEIAPSSLPPQSQAVGGGGGAASTAASVSAASAAGCVHEEVEPLLRVARGLLSCRNGAVVMSASMLLLQLAPRAQAPSPPPDHPTASRLPRLTPRRPASPALPALRTPAASPLRHPPTHPRRAPASPQAVCVVKPLCRLARSPRREVAYGALHAIVALSASRPELLAPELRDFFVVAREAVAVSELRLQVLANLASAATMPAIGRELDAYLRSPQEELVRLAVRAAARCAFRVPAVAERCLQSLLALLSSGSDATVGEVVNAVRALLATQPAEAQPRIVSRLAAMLPQLTLPYAREAVVWSVGEYCAQLPHVAPDVLRAGLLTFTEEASVVKLQLLTLAAKASIKQLDSAQPMLRYALDLARYDADIDVRARARLLAALVAPSDGGGTDAPLTPLQQHAEMLICAPKPPPTAAVQEAGAAAGAGAGAGAADSQAGGARYVGGSLSQMLGRWLPGHAPLPAFAADATDSALRMPAGTAAPSAAPPSSSTTSAAAPTPAAHSPAPQVDFYGEPLGSAAVAPPGRSPAAPTGAAAAAAGVVHDDDGSYYTTSEDEDAPRPDAPRAAAADAPRRHAPPKLIDMADDADSLTAALAAAPLLAPAPAAAPPSPGAAAAAPPVVTQPDGAGLDLDALMPFTPAPTSGADGPPSAPPPPASAPTVADDLRWLPLLDFTNGNGLAATFQFTRQQSMLASSSACVLRLKFTNRSSDALANVGLVKVQLGPGQNLTPFVPISHLGAGGSAETNLHIDFAGSRQPLRFHLASDRGAFPAEIRPPQGELLRPAPLSRAEFAAIRAR